MKGVLQEIEKKMTSVKENGQRFIPMFFLFIVRLSIPFFTQAAKLTAV